MATKKSTEKPAKSASKTASTSASKTPAKTPAKKSAAAPEPAKPASEKKEPSHEEIGKLAHQYWKDRGHHHGSHEDDWHRAERELKSRS